MTIIVGNWEIAEVLINANSEPQSLRREKDKSMPIKNEALNSTTLKSFELTLFSKDFIQLE